MDEQKMCCGTTCDKNKVAEHIKYLEDRFNFECDAVNLHTNYQPTDIKAALLDVSRTCEEIINMRIAPVFEGKEQEEEGDREALVIHLADLAGSIMCVMRSLDGNVDREILQALDVVWNVEEH